MKLSTGLTMGLATVAAAASLTGMFLTVSGGGKAQAESDHSVSATQSDEDRAATQLNWKDDTQDGDDVNDYLHYDVDTRTGICVVMFPHFLSGGSSDLELNVIPCTNDVLALVSPKKAAAYAAKYGAPKP